MRLHFWTWVLVGAAAGVFLCKVIFTISAFVSAFAPERTKR